MINVKEFELTTNDRCKELENRVNEFMKENGLWDTHIINITWQKPMVATLIYRTERIK